MANKGEKHLLNIAGSWYCTSVEDSNGEGCIACGVCYAECSDFFTEDDDGNAYVLKQPSSDSEISACKEVMEDCPVNAIGNDG